jgi:flagellar motor switch protein FliG
MAAPSTVLTPTAPPSLPDSASQQSGLSGPKKAAILLTIVGNESGAAICRHLSEEEAHDVAREVTLLESISEAERSTVLKDFLQTAANIDLYRTGGLEYAKSVLIGAFGPDAGKRMADRLSKSIGTNTSGVEALRKTDPQHMAKVLHQEHPQTIALVLCHLGTSQAARLLMSLPTELRGPVVRRMASLEQISPEVIDRLAKTICAKLRILGEASLESCGGVRAVAQILNRLEGGASEAILDEISAEDAPLEQNIKQLMFVFGDLVNVSKQSLKTLLARADRKILTLALKGASANLKRHITSLMSTRAAEMMEEDLAALGPVRIRDVQDAQAQIMALASQLQSEGVISLQSESNDQYVE